jgi:hypothetical protein
VSVSGIARGAGTSARSTYTFRRSSIVGQWQIRATTRRQRSAEVLFPSWGGNAAAVWALLRDGTAVKLESARPRQGIRGFWVQSEHTGYAVVPVDRVKGSVARIIQPERQTSAPKPGPTLSVLLTHRVARKRPVRFSARLVIARDVGAAQRALR